MIYGISRVFYIRQLEDRWDFIRDTIYIQVLREPPDLDDIGKYIQRYD